MIGTASQPAIRTTMTSDKYMADLLAFDSAIFTQYFERFLNELFEAVFVFELAAARVRCIAWPLRKNQNEVLTTRCNLLAQFVLCDRLTHIVAPPMQINEHIGFRRAVKPSRNKQTDRAIGVMRVAGDRDLVVDKSFLATLMGKGSRFHRHEGCLAFFAFFPVDRAVGIG